MVALLTLARPFLPYIFGAVALVGVVWAFHHRAFEAGRAACEAEHITTNLEVKNVQQDIEARRARSRDELIDRLLNDQNL